MLNTRKKVQTFTIGDKVELRIAELLDWVATGGFELPTVVQGTKYHVYQMEEYPSGNVLWLRPVRAPHTLISVPERFVAHVS